MGILRGAHHPAVTARTVHLESRREGRAAHLHDMLGGRHVVTLAGGGATDVRAALSSRLARACVAIERALRAAGAERVLIEIGGGNATLMFDAAAVATAFERTREAADSELRWVDDPPSMNNVLGLVSAYRRGNRGGWSSG